MGVLSSSIETRIKLVSISINATEVKIEVTKTHYDGGITIGEPRIVERTLTEGQEITL